MCAFAHSEDELSVDFLHKMEFDVDFYLFHFKTVWCPYNKDDKDHARDMCVYAHNWQDFRRKQHIFRYSEKQCNLWEIGRKTRTYSDGCPLEYRCNFCHGWKEQEYHFMCYKTTECRNPNSCHKAHCPYYHTEAEQRIPNINACVFPKNRGTNFSL